MHLENHRVKRVVPVLYILVLLFGAIYYFFSEIYNFSIGFDLATALFLLSILFLIHKYFLFFKYDSSSNALIFKNSGLFLSNVLEYRTKNLSIEKGKLIKFKVTSFIIGYKLRLTYKQNYQLQTKTFLFSFVNKKRIRDLKYSLTKALENK